MEEWMEDERILTVETLKEAKKLLYESKPKFESGYFCPICQHPSGSWSNGPILKHMEEKHWNK